MNGLFFGHVNRFGWELGPPIASVKEFPSIGSELRERQRGRCIKSVGKYDSLDGILLQKGNKLG